MSGQEIISKVKALNLPANSYVVFGSCPLAVAGIRPSDDIDLFITPELFSALKQNGWQEVDKGSAVNPLRHDIFEAYDNWDIGDYRPTVAQLLASADIIDGVPVVSLAEVRKWKQAMGRPKDRADIHLIDQFLGPH
ncbi:MAG TPA: hypothetical protein VFP35_02515 [Candidatus Saccharimonadales bacterium]|nr:hypothetical protein [Candidatus Saccharimonadales bacterium]